MAKRIRARLTPAEGRKFAFTVGAAFLVLAGLSWWRGKHITSTVFQILGILLILAGAVAPAHLGPVQRTWMGLAHAISKVTTPIFLSVIYFVVITPAGLVMRLCGRKPLEPAEGSATYWVTRAKAPTTANGMLEQF